MYQGEEHEVRSITGPGRVYLRSVSGQARSAATDRIARVSAAAPTTEPRAKKRKQKSAKKAKAKAEAKAARAALRAAARAEKDHAKRQAKAVRKLLREDTMSKIKEALRIRRKHETAVAAKLGIDPVATKRQGAREKLQGIQETAEAKAIRAFARRGVSADDARRQAKAFAMNVVEFLAHVRKGEAGGHGASVNAPTIADQAAAWGKRP
jgi:hypothetical protein